MGTATLAAPERPSVIEPDTSSLRRRETGVRIRMAASGPEGASAASARCGAATPGAAHSETDAHLFSSCDAVLRSISPVAVHSFDSRNVLRRSEPILHVPARAANVEHGFDRRVDVPSANADQVSSSSRLALPRYQNDVAGLAFGTPLLVLHRRPTSVTPPERLGCCGQRARGPRYRAADTTPARRLCQPLSS